MLLLCYISGPVAQNTASATAIIIITSLYRGARVVPHKLHNLKKRHTAVKEMHFELCPTETRSPSTHPRNVHNDLVLKEGQEKKKKKESYRQSRIDETARLCSRCNNREGLRLTSQVLYSDWCRLPHSVTGTC